MSSVLRLGRPQFITPGTSTQDATSAESATTSDAGGSQTAAEPDAEQPGPAQPRPQASARERGSDQLQRSEHLRRQLQAAWQATPETLAPETAPLDLSQLGQLPEQAREVGQGGKGEPAGDVGAGGKGGVFSDAGRDYAQQALSRTKPPALHHPYMQQKAQERADLERLGLMKPGTGRVHIDDGDPMHGGSVTRTAVGATSLAQGAETSLNVSGVPEEYRLSRRSPQQLARGQARIDGVGAESQGKLTGDQYAQSIANQLEGTLLDHGDAVGYARSQLPEDSRDTFMNMSWGQTPERLINDRAGKMLMAPEGSVAYEEVTQLLGHPPTRDTDENGHTKLKKEEFQAVHAHLAGKVDTVLQSPEQQARMQTARSALETELKLGREQGLLVFASAGNEQASAERHGRPDLAVNVASGAEGLIMVGATDLNGPGTEDDRVADFSNQGQVTLSAAGVGLPVGVGALDEGAGIGALAPTVDQDGTSMASPVALEAAYLADAVNPDLGVNEIAALLTDPRAVHDIAGTKRDGAGQVDHFAVALLAANPQLSRAQIDVARATLRNNPSDAQVAALKTRLGLD